MTIYLNGSKLFGCVFRSALYYRYIQRYYGFLVLSRNTKLWLHCPIFTTNKFLIVPADKAPNNIVFICKNHFLNRLIFALNKFFGHHHKCVDHNYVLVSQLTSDSLISLDANILAWSLILPIVSYSQIVTFSLLANSNDGWCTIHSSRRLTCGHVDLAAFGVCAIPCVLLVIFKCLLILYSRNLHIAKLLSP